MDKKQLNSKNNKPLNRKLLGRKHKGKVYMSKALKKLWIDNLLSGKYKQGKGTLRSVDKYRHSKYCCLGVLCKILQKNGFPIKNINKTYFSFNEETRNQILPPSLSVLIGISSDQQSSLASANDGNDVVEIKNPITNNVSRTMKQFSFKEIAAIIQNKKLST